MSVTISNSNPSLKDEQDEEYVPPDVATLDLTGGAPTDDDAVAAAAAAATASSGAAGGAEVIITAPASLEESIVAVLDPDQGQVQQVALTRSAIYPVLMAAVRKDQVNYILFKEKEMYGYDRAECWKWLGLQINQLESVLQTDEAKEVLGAALLTTAAAASAVGEDGVVHADDVDDNDDMIEGVLALNTTDASFQSDDIVRDEIEEDVSGVSREEGEEEVEPGTERAMMRSLQTGGTMLTCMPCRVP